MRPIGAIVNVVLRTTIVGILADALLRPEDPRYRGKAIGTRGLVMIPLGMLVPVAHASRGQRGAARPYPIWTDNLWLSIFALDLAGNYFDWYDTHRYFDAIPHAHGTGAATVVAAQLADLPALSAIGAAQVGHVLLEAQEYYSDVWFGLRNVRGTWDTVNDLLAGVAGSLAYGAALAWWRRSRV